MEIFYEDRKLEKAFGNLFLLARRYGPRCAERIQERLEQFGKAKNLAELREAPQGRCHELKGNRAGTLAVDVKHPYRLIFERGFRPASQKA